MQVLCFYVKPINLIGDLRQGRTPAAASGETTSHLIRTRTRRTVRTFISSSLQQVGTTQFSRTVSYDKIPGSKRRAPRQAVPELLRRTSNVINIFQLWSIRTSAGIKGSESNQRTRTTLRCSDRTNRAQCFRVLTLSSCSLPIMLHYLTRKKTTNTRTMKPWNERNTAKPKQAVHAGKIWEEVMLHVPVQISWVSVSPEICWEFPPDK